MDVDTGWLRAFLVLSEELHFGRAAARLGITQQALSKRMARLEARVAGTLVDRSDRRRLRLTPRGQELLPLVGDTLVAADRLMARTTLERRVRIDTMGDYLAPHQWVYRAARSGELSIDVLTRPAEATADHLLLNGEADFAFGRAGAVPRPWPPALRHRIVLLEPLALAAPPGHPLAGREAVTMAELRGHRLWFPLAAAPGEWRAYLAEFAEAFHLAIETSGSTFGYQQWLADLAAGRAAPSLVGEAMRLPDSMVSVVPIIDPTPVYPWTLFWTARTEPADVERVLAAIGFPHPPPAADDSLWFPPGEARQ